MKILVKIERSTAPKSGICCRALTLVEMMITMAIFSIVVAALAYAQIFGMRQDQLVESKLGASDASRMAFEQLSREVRGASMINIGTVSSGNWGSWSMATNGSLQVGNAIQLYLNATNSNYILYYFNTTIPGNTTLCRWHTGDATNTYVAYALTNWYNSPLQFVCEDYAGNTNSTRTTKNCIHFILGFAQYQYPLTRVGSNYLYDFYKLEFRLASHAPAN
jgi:prepilin-type N-terminal cleavage/methylation domain-containing protein